MQDLAVFSGKHAGNFPADAHHLVTVIAVGDDIDIRPHHVEDREAINGEAADATRRRVLVGSAFSFESLKAVCQTSGPVVREFDIRS